MGEPSTVPGRLEGGVQPVLSYEFSPFPPFLLAFDVGGLGFEFCVFVAGWRHGLRSEWPFIIIARGLEPRLLVVLDLLPTILLY